MRDISWVQLIATLTGALLLQGCDDRWSRLDPPKIVQLTCRTDKADPLLVFAIDTGLRKVTWVNGTGAPEGRAVATEYEYQLSFPRTSQSYESRAVVNRYDGVMEREFGSPPFLQPNGALKAGNVRQRWRCSVQKAGPQL